MIDLAFKAYIDFAYEKCAEFHLTCHPNINVEFNPSLNYRSGIAGQADYKSNTIQISSYLWNNGPYLELYREMLILHEFGHLVLNKDHTLNPYDIMYVKGMDIEYYKANRSTVIYNLFDKNHRIFEGIVP